MIKELSNLTSLQFHLVTESKKVTSNKYHHIPSFSAKNIRNFTVSVIRVLTVPGVTRVMGVIDESVTRVTGVTGFINEVLQCLYYRVPSPEGISIDVGLRELLT